MKDTLPRMVLRQCDRFKGRTVMRRKQAGQYRDISWTQCGEKIALYARSLMALGLRPGQQVAIMAPNRPEWAWADLGIMAAGGRTVPVYHTEGLKTILHILADSQSRFLFAHSSSFVSDLLDSDERPASLEKIILLEGACPHPQVIAIDAFVALAAKIKPEAFQKVLAAGKRDEIATLVYTSGTTGTPKGAILTHDNLLSNVESCCHLIQISDADQCLSFLPLSHIFERMAGYYLMLHQGVTIAYAESIDTVPANLAEINPTIVISVPRLYEKMYNRVLERVSTGSWLKRQLFYLAVKAGKARVACQQQGEKPGFGLNLAMALFSHLVFAKLQQRLGGKLRFFVSGGAPLAREIAEFFLAAGIPIYEGYGLTETSPVIAVNYPGRHRLGSVGPPLKNLQIRVDEDGELRVKGPSVFQGYWQRDTETAAAMEDGWLRTGDIARIDTDGYLHITDRKKDLIITAGGKNVAPQEIENHLKSDRYISSLMIQGERKPFLTALVVPDFEALGRYADYKQIDFLDHCDLVNHPQILNLIRRRIDRLQQGLPNYKRIRRFTLLSRDFSAAKEEVTPTLKLRRKAISEHFAPIIENIYQPEGEGIHDTSFCIIDSVEDDG